MTGPRHNGPMPFTTTFLHHGDTLTVTVDVEDVPLPKARILFAGIAGTIRGCEGRQESVDAMVDAVLAAIAEYRHAGRVVSRTPEAIAFGVAKS